MILTGLMLDMLDCITRKSSSPTLRWGRNGPYACPWGQWDWWCWACRTVHTSVYWSLTSSKYSCKFLFKRIKTELIFHTQSWQHRHVVWCGAVALWGTGREGCGETGRLTSCYLSVLETPNGSSSLSLIWWYNVDNDMDTLVPVWSKHLLHLFHTS